MKNIVSNTKALMIPFPKSVPKRWDAILDDSTFIEKFASTREKSFMTMDESIVLSHEIARRVSTLPDQPKVVIGIGGGALLLSKVISSKLSIPLEILWVQRKGSMIKEKFFRIPWMVALISLWYQVPVLNIPLKFIIEQFSGLIPISHKLTPNIKGKHVLLIDDVIETGQTLIAAKNIISASGARSITTAVLVWSDRTVSNKKENIRPDIFIGRRVQHFPWSMNSPYFRIYERWLQQPHV